MTTLDVNGVSYGIEFRTRHRPKPKKLIRAITTCVIYRDGLMGIGNSICIHQDVLVRRDGMRRAFQRAAADCREKTWDREGLLRLLDEKWPARKATLQPKKPRRVPAPDLVEAWRNEPSAVRKRQKRVAKKLGVQPT